MDSDNRQGRSDGKKRNHRRRRKPQNRNRNNENSGGEKRAQNKDSNQNSEKRNARGNRNNRNQNGNKNQGNRNSRGGRNNNNRRRQGRSRNSGGKKYTGLEGVYFSYINLLQEHLATRKKYYELFHRADPRQLEKLERNYKRSMDNMRNYEEKLSPEQKKYLESRVDGLTLDHTYSSNHEISPEGEQEIDLGNLDNDYQGPHFLLSQANAKEDWSTDEEESVGSFEDYKKLKGIE